MRADLDAYWQNDLREALPVLSLDQQRTALSLYEALSTGVPVDTVGLAPRLGIGPAEVTARLALTIRGGNDE